MNLRETAQLLAKVQLVDNRQVDELTVREWHDLLGHIELAHALEAVRMHRRSSSDYLLPAHVARGAALVRERLVAQGRLERQLAARQLEARARATATPRDVVWQRMLADPDESEATKRFIRERLGGDA